MLVLRHFALKSSLNFLLKFIVHLSGCKGGKTSPQTKYFKEKKPFSFKLSRKAFKDEHHSHLCWTHVFFSVMVKKTELSHQGQKNVIVRTGRMGAFFSPNSSNAGVVKKNICIQKFSLETFWFTNPLCMYGERIRNSFPGRSRS